MIDWVGINKILIDRELRMKCSGDCSRSLGELLNKGNKMDIKLVHRNNVEKVVITIDSQEELVKFRYITAGYLVQSHPYDTAKDMARDLTSTLTDVKII